MPSIAGNSRRPANHLSRHRRCTGWLKITPRYGPLHLSPLTPLLPQEAVPHYSFTGTRAITKKGTTCLRATQQGLLQLQVSPQFQQQQQNHPAVKLQNSRNCTDPFALAYRIASPRVISSISQFSNTVAQAALAQSTKSLHMQTYRISILGRKRFHLSHNLGGLSSE